ncbi:MAG: hypothetical protein HUJ68_05695, partial [Clostridia bacterium]|nr:hypothetical protein [Clostridia bacterium]
TYKINITPDLLSTGMVNNYELKQDYITLKEVDEEYKLNINSYIGRKIKNNETNQENIYFKINYVDTYMDYVKYNITVKNNNSKTIYLDTKKDVKTMYLEDKKGIKYSAITNEIKKEDLIYIPLDEKTFDIKYYSKYSSSKTIMKLVFSNVIFDSNEDKVISINM